MLNDIENLINSRPLSSSDTQRLFDFFLSNSAEKQELESALESYLLSTADLLPSASEIVGAALSLRSQMMVVPVARSLAAIDTCGTGGSGHRTFNTSTAAAFVCVGAGLKVAKHGNRAVSSKTGSADVLEKLGVPINLSSEQVATRVVRDGFGFMFAPLFHPATKQAAVIRKKLGVRTIFNFLGPLVNPAKVVRQVVGVSSIQMMPVLAQSLAELGVERALVVRGQDGLDEITLTGNSDVFEVENGRIISYSVCPEDFMLSKVSMDLISVDSVEQSAQKILEVLNGVPGPLFDLTVLNAGAAIYVSGKEPSIAAGIEEARRSILSGMALAALKKAQAE